MQILNIIPGLGPVAKNDGRNSKLATSKESGIEDRYEPRLSGEYDTQTKIRQALRITRSEGKKKPACNSIRLPGVKEWGSGPPPPPKSGPPPLPGTGPVEQPVNETFARHRARQDAFNIALKTGKPVTMTNLMGNRVEVSVRQLKGKDGKTDSYQLVVDGSPLKVNIGKGLERDFALPRIADYYSQQPKHLRGVVHTVNVNKGRNPKDPYWAKEYNRPNFRSAATGGHGEINFYDGTRNIEDDIFDHEFGHNLGQRIRTGQGKAIDFVNRMSGLKLKSDKPEGLDVYVPLSYDQAVKKDNRSVSCYGDTNSAEDFAEIWKMYSNAKERGPEGMSYLKRVLQHRLNVVKDLEKRVYFPAE